ncbi:MAG: DUF975 family protein [Chitinivibrionales bacterium]|nr:DUF975 family protein [Chitinivibrionales bacterium]
MSEDQEIKRCPSCGRVLPAGVSECDCEGRGNPAAETETLERQDTGESTISSLRNRPANAEIASQARERLKGRWGVAVLATLIWFLLSGCAQGIPKIGWIIGFFVAGPFMLGMQIFALNLARRRDVEVAMVFHGFHNYWTAVLAYLLQSIFIILWSLLLIVPGIIAALSYAMTYFIIVDEPAIAPIEAIRKSKEMMMGHKARLFMLGLRFIGWALLCILTLGIGFLWLIPYMQVSFALFYEDLKQAVS